MKKSRLYLSTTIAGICVFMVLSVVYARMFAVSEEAWVPERPGATELAQLSGFTSISVQGNFRLEVFQQADFSVEYNSATEQGELRTELVGSELRMTGFGNRTDSVTSVVRIGLPELQELKANFLPHVTVASFNSNELVLGFVNTQTVLLQNNQVQTLNLTATFVGELMLQGNSFTNEELHIRGGNMVINRN